MLVNFMKPVLVPIEWKAKLISVNHKWRHDIGFPEGINMKVNHELLMTIGINQHTRIFFFMSLVPFSKIDQFLTFLHSKNTKSKETYALTTHCGIWFNGLQLWGTAGRQSLWTFQEQLEKHLTQDVSFNYAGLTTQPQTHHRVGGITSCFIVLLESWNREGCSEQQTLDLRPTPEIFSCNTSINCTWNCFSQSRSLS